MGKVSLRSNEGDGYADIFYRIEKSLPAADKKHLKTLGPLDIAEDVDLSKVKITDKKYAPLQYLISNTTNKKVINAMKGANSTDRDGVVLVMAKFKGPLTQQQITATANRLYAEAKKIVKVGNTKDGWTRPWERLDIIKSELKLLRTLAKRYGLDIEVPTDLAKLTYDFDSEASPYRRSSY